MLVELEPFIISRFSFVIYLSLGEELHLKILIGVLEIEAHVIVEEKNFLLSLFRIIYAPELELRHVAHDVDAVILFFHCVIEFDTFAIRL